MLCGGGGSGKSIFAGEKILERVTSEPGHRWLVCRKVAKTLRESCFKQLIWQSLEYFPDAGMKQNKSDMLIEFKNGSQIIFAGLDDVEKLKSIFNITGIWIEEASEISEADFNQLDIRLRGETPYYKQIIVTFNPVSITHWLKARFFDKAAPEATTHHSTYRDNRFLDEAAVKVLEAYRETDEYYYMVYCLGQWGVTGKTVFDGKAVTERLRQVREAGSAPHQSASLPASPEGEALIRRFAPPSPKGEGIRDGTAARVGLFEYEYDGLSVKNIRFVEDKTGCVRLYSAPDPAVPYVIGADTAGEGSDWFVCQVLDNVTGVQAATLRGHFDEDVFARQAYCLGMYFNEALIGIEANFSTYPIRELERLRYRRQYVREVEDTYTGRISKAYGFKTTATTRPIIISELIKAMREHISFVHDEDTLLEMLTFVRNEKLRPEAEAGAHDDCVMALAIAYYIRPQQRASPFEPERKSWSESMWEDYENAGAAERKYLIEKWGRPKGRDGK